METPLSYSKLYDIYTLPFNTGVHLLCSAWYQGIATLHCDVLYCIQIASFVTKKSLLCVTVAHWCKRSWQRDARSFSIILRSLNYSIELLHLGRYVSRCRPWCFGKNKKRAQSMALGGEDEKNTWATKMKFRNPGNSKGAWLKKVLGRIEWD